MEVGSGNAECGKKGLRKEGGRGKREDRRRKSECGSGEEKIEVGIWNAEVGKRR
jgi:hypothetical protein